MIGIEPFFPSHQVRDGPINVHNRPGDKRSVLGVTEPHARLEHRAGLVVTDGNVWIYVRAESGIAGWVRQDEVVAIE